MDSSRLCYFLEAGTVVSIISEFSWNGEIGSLERQNLKSTKKEGGVEGDREHRIFAKTLYFPIAFPNQM
ncbi:MAG: hypothetical protein F6K35_21975 [Okeania sp. SIO2H7]|nr:hypothetical protein [Okeania sp. SIO2H7]